MIYKCICGKTHTMTKDGVRCSGRGHLVYLSPGYYNYSLKNELRKLQEQKEKNQLNLF